MAEKLGPRVIVLVGKDKDGKAVYSNMLKRTADYFGFTPYKGIPSRKSSRGRIIVTRGAKGSGSIKVPTGKTTTKGSTAYKAIPMPNGMSIPKVAEFLKKATKNKPTSFVTEDGRTWPVS